MNEASVYEKALRLQSDARRLAEGQAGQREALRIARRVGEMRVQLAELRSRLELAPLVSESTGEPIEASAASSGLVEFRAKAQLGDHPSDAVFTKAANRIKATCAAIDDQISHVWSTWAKAKLEELPAARLPLLPAKERTAARKRLAELERAADKPVASRSDIELFRLSLDTLTELLADAAEVPEEVLGLLELLSQSPPTTLAQITDEQISLLRAAGLADEVILTRKGT